MFASYDLLLFCFSANTADLRLPEGTEMLSARHEKDRPASFVSATVRGIGHCRETAPGVRIRKRILPVFHHHNLNHFIDRTILNIAGITL